MPAAASSNKAAFRPNTRQRFAKVATVNAAFSTQQDIPFPQVGLLSRIFIYANTTISDAASSPSVTATTYGPYNVLKRIKGNLNLGTSTVFDMSGYGAYQVNKVTDTCIETKVENTDVTSATSGTNNLYQYPTTYVQTTAKSVQFVIMIPVSINDGPQFHIGLINLQAPEVRFTLSLIFGQASDVYTTSDTLTLAGTVSVYYQYYEVPNPDAVQLPPRVMHRLLEERTAIVATGDTTYLVPRQGVLLQLIHTLTLNGAISANTTDLVSRRLVFNKTDTPYNMDYIADRIYNRFRYGFSGSDKDLPAGTFLWDFFDADQAPTRGDLRDAIDTEALSTLESILTINSGATLGSGNNFVDSVRRITQQY
jgi:hypothetical protein